MTVDAMEVFEREVVRMCRERGYQRRFSPEEIDGIVRAMVDGFAMTLHELADYIEREDWDGLAALAMQAETMRSLRRRA